MNVPLLRTFLMEERGPLPRRLREPEPRRPLERRSGIASRRGRVDMMLLVVGG